MADNLLEAVQHASVCVGSGGPGGLQLSAMLSVGRIYRVRVVNVAHTRVLTTSNGYLVMTDLVSGVRGYTRGWRGRRKLTSPESRHGAWSASWPGALGMAKYL